VGIPADAGAAAAVEVPAGALLETASDIAVGDSIIRPQSPHAPQPQYGTGEYGRRT
jgi:hypothetical protein